MQEKSSSQTSQQRKTPLDRFTDILWEHCDIVAGIGVAVLIMTLFHCILNII